ncbi:MAG TPA: DUF1326 domain-containing protein [Gemmataceae bacterium]|jgi:hypothetical protein|nr:DUF1326 domain-containing protein [Gemmataceae bacterium]
MRFCFFLAAVAACIAVSSSLAGEITGKYVEARTCDVYTGPCFANADTGLTGRHAVMAWKIDKGSLGDVRLDGLGVVAVIAAGDTLGTPQVCSGKAIVIVDEKANSAQKEALVQMVRKQAGQLAENIISVTSGKVELTIRECHGTGCARVEAGDAKVETRCLDTQHDKGCGNESAFYPPLARGVSATPAVSTEHSFLGKAFNETWQDAERRGAYVGTFTIR